MNWFDSEDVGKRFVVTYKKNGTPVSQTGDVVQADEGDNPIVLRVGLAEISIPTVDVVEVFEQ